MGQYATMCAVYKAILSDFDGTLAGEDHVLSAEDKRAILEFLNKGFIFSIATGRAYEGVIERTCKSLNLMSLQIVRGGSEIVNPADGSVVWGEYVENSVVYEIIEYLLKRKINFAVEQGKYVYTHNAKPFKDLGEGANMRKLKDFDAKKTPKILVFPRLSLGQCEEIMQTLTNNYSRINVVKIHKKNKFGLDINSSKASKFIAVHEFAKLSKIKRKEIVGVGDNYNDYPLLTACGVKVAVGNAVDELKEIADYIAPSQDENAIAGVINKYFQ